LADGGTLFLDEIGEIPLDMQAKLLRVLQEGELERIGEERTRKVNVRIIAATNRDLPTEAEAGRFRQDLYYRLSVFPLQLPPLRKRLEDVPLLAEHFLGRFARRLGQSKFKLTMANIQDLQRYSWPGNVRELQHVLERACIVSERGRLRFDHLRETASAPTLGAAPLADDRILTAAEVRKFEARNIQAALKRTNGKIYGDDGAAALLGMKPTTLVSRTKALRVADS
jgi:transcriptional regulator with GAF, ATPase, and Fis domain